MPPVDLYDKLAGSYDMFISWKSRLKREKPFYQSVFKEYGVKRILDTACGTGMHVMAFYDWKYHVTGTDVSAAMIEKSIENSGDRKIDFIQAGFNQSDKIDRMFDAVTCIGNSLPHVLTDEGLFESLESFYNAILPGGILILHSNNYDRILKLKERFMPLAKGRQNKNECLFLRFFDFLDNGLLRLNVVALEQSSGDWSVHPDSSMQRPMTKALLEDALTKTGFDNLRFYGGFPNQPFDETESDNLIIIAQKPHTFVSKPIPEPVKAINSIPIRENNEPILDLAVAAPELLLAAESMYARERVVNMLKKASSYLPDGYKLIIKTAYRPMELQQKMYWDFYQSISDSYPNWPKSQIRREVNKFLAPPDAKHPPGHTTGGAIDLSIVDPSGKELDMVSTIDGGSDDMKMFRTYAKNITPFAAKNRQMLIDIMIKAGFSNYPGEWWHWSYGDSAWAVRVNTEFALYGAVLQCIKDK